MSSPQARMLVLAGAVTSSPTTISGTVGVNNSLTSTGTGQWYREGVAISGETGSSYTSVAADIRTDGGASITQDNGSGPSNALDFDVDTYFANMAIGTVLGNTTPADSSTTIDAWWAMWGGLKSLIPSGAPLQALTSLTRPAYNPTGGPGGIPLVTFQGVNQVLSKAAVTFGGTWGGIRGDIIGYCVGAETLGDRMMVYNPGSGNSIDWGVNATPRVRLNTVGTGGAAIVGTTTITGSYRQMSGTIITGASGSEDVRINNTSENTSSITHAAYADGGTLTIGGTSVGTTCVNMNCLGWALGIVSGATAVLGTNERATLRALFQNMLGIS